MPTYEYVCEACGHEFERFQKISADPVRKCPECGRRKVRRRISAGGGLVFKGPGFYATDYRKPPPPGEAGGASKEKSTGEKSSDSKKSGGSDD
ncbi:MAG: zinc ribbon domain-containing protein [Gemmatimonadota bacterium]|nr:zinc ribbon domain-containing protein [Gemmatimonadota bacterium]